MLVWFSFQLWTVSSAWPPVEPASLVFQVACEHYASRAECYICEPNLRDTSRLWCGEHSRYEDRCFLCHPEIREEGRLYCKEHFLYEDECYMCRPEMAGPQANGEQKTGALFCNEHQLEERECGICHPELLEGLAVGQGLKIRFATEESSHLAGVKAQTIHAEAEVVEQSFVSRVIFNQNRIAKLIPLAHGVLRQVRADVGQVVQKGEVLAEVNSMEVAQLKGEYLESIAELELKEAVFEREKKLHEKLVTSKQEYELALAELKKSRTHSETKKSALLNFGFLEDEIADIREQGDASSYFPLKSPLNGTIVKRNAVSGEVVSGDEPLFVIADLANFWLEVSLPISSFSQFELGSPVTSRFQGLADQEFPGHVFWISSEIDPKSRMVMARAELDNSHGLLKEGLFGESRLRFRDHRHLQVPKTAVQRVEEQDIVFVKHAPDLYEIRKVILEPVSSISVAIAEGLSAHEAVVLEGSFVVKSEYLKSRLGAGCVHD